MTEAGARPPRRTYHCRPASVRGDPSLAPSGDAAAPAALFRVPSPGFPPATGPDASGALEPYSPAGPFCGSLPSSFAIPALPPSFPRLKPPLPACPGHRRLRRLYCTCSPKYGVRGGGVDPLHGGGIGCDPSPRPPFPFLRLFDRLSRSSANPMVSRDNFAAVQEIVEERRRLSEPLSAEIRWKTHCGAAVLTGLANRKSAPYHRDGQRLKGVPR